MCLCLCLCLCSVLPFDFDDLDETKRLTRMAWRALLFVLPPPNHVNGNAAVLAALARLCLALRRSHSTT